MAAWAIDLASISRRGCFAWFSGGRTEGLGRKAAADHAQDEDRPAKGAPTSWITRSQALWSRSLEPLRPLDAPRARATAWDASWPLPRELTSVRRARRLATAQLSEWNLEDLADTAELLVSELVTNALRHTRGPLRLNLYARGSDLRCEVEDTDSTGPVRRVVDADAEGGRGTELLDLLTETWGSTRTATGKTMWFEISTRTP
ncbi:ATP-binding protein [Streptomyces sp. NPDC048448]|uniref:ATP-binding protein n=1 Tax=Streptomyces kaempferi TaxID=333725 RepID=A0ABW3XTI4_9ACTN|nr:MULTISPECIES: ATP-binding protein [unclassified Streptomyces]